MNSLTPFLYEQKKNEGKNKEIKLSAPSSHPHRVFTAYIYHRSYTLKSDLFVPPFVPHHQPQQRQLQHHHHGRKKKKNHPTTFSPLIFSSVLTSFYVQY